MTKLPKCDEDIMSKIPEAQIGSILMIAFSSSTLWTVTRFQRFGGAFESLASSSVIIAALSNHLQIYHRAVKILLQILCNNIFYVNLKLI